MKRHLYGILALTSLLLLSATSEAGASPLTYLKKTQAKLTKMAKANASDAKLKRAVNKLLDFDVLAKTSMRQHWTTLTAAQQSEFKKAFRMLLEKKYIKGIRSKATYNVKYTGQKLKGANATVFTHVTYMRKGRERQETVSYRMRRSGGRWLVVDVITGGVSMERNYRNSFNRIMKKKGFADLLKKLQRKAAKLKTRP